MYVSTTRLYGQGLTGNSEITIEQSELQEVQDDIQDGIQDGRRYLKQL